MCGRGARASSICAVCSRVRLLHARRPNSMRHSSAEKNTALCRGGRVRVLGVCGCITIDFRLFMRGSVCDCVYICTAYCTIRTCTYCVCVYVHALRTTTTAPFATQTKPKSIYHTPNDLSSGVLYNDFFLVGVCVCVLVFFVLCGSHPRCCELFLTTTRLAGVY